ncbi:MAG: M20/M25/M40 family metallo-hydrolase, partial [Rhodococcus sp.]|nr:M20/M25/M40 family metallo-hydrolase [Rhodococcus sp. (in: high G+C Gram-positive bacteria)]
MDAGALTPREQHVVEVVRSARDELVATVGELVACDTTARITAEPARDEAALQSILGKRLSAIGAEVDIWEPDPIPAGHPLWPEMDFVGRPQLAAVIRGSGGGASMLTSGHIDAVGADASGWSSNPHKAVERDGLLYGRGVVDMKGGIASLLVAVEALHRSDIKLCGDIVYTTNTDEETTGVGSWTITQ